MTHAPDPEAEGKYCQFCSMSGAPSPAMHAPRAERRWDVDKGDGRRGVATAALNVRLCCKHFHRLGFTCETYPGVCARCGRPKLHWQVYCGAACTAKAEADE